jgi:hypothetical protein
MAELLGSKDFAAHLHTVFRVEAPEVVELELAAVKDQSNAQVEQFSLIFKGPASLWLPQGTYTLLHPAMERMALFLVPLGARGGRMTYEAVFARLIASTRQASSD